MTINILILKICNFDCRIMAEHVLEKAQRVISALKAAKDTQEEAEQAINTAHQDITATKKDLKQVFINFFLFIVS